MNSAVGLLAEFPSGAWFDALVEDVHCHAEEYERLGFADCRLALEVIDSSGKARWFGLVLNGYDIRSEGELADLDSFAPDVVLSGARSIWEEMLANIVEHRGADRSHTLNALSIAGFPLTTRSPDPMGRDKFYRYAETIQRLFDSAWRLAVTGDQPVG
ncbi:MAG: hypothetical protein M1115_02250 [Actinobacteria bacterium]|nr:hypothetical protein [Actinomycetota bacterium]